MSISQLIAQNLEFWLSPKFLFAAPQFLGLTYKAPPSSDHLAEFCGDRLRGLWDFTRKPFAFKIVLGSRPGPILVATLSKFTYFQSCLKGSR